MDRDADTEDPMLEHTPKSSPKDPSEGRKLKQYLAAISGKNLGRVVSNSNNF